MAFILGGVTLPQPKKLTYNIIEVAQEHLIMYGKTTKNIQKRKYQYILEYTFLTEAQVASLESLFLPGTVISFQSTETNLLIGPIDVLMDITKREYPQVGTAIRENVVVTLNEVTGS